MHRLLSGTIALLVSCLLAPIVSASGAEVSGDGQLAKWRGSTRPIVILSDSRDDPRVARQVAALDRARPALQDRNIKVLREAQPGSALRKTLGVEDKGFAVVLVGKDGSVKKVWRDPVAPKRIFTLIDAMPMRRNEMRDDKELILELIFPPTGVCGCI